MIKSSYTLFSVFGIPVRADLSLLILAFLMISSFGDPFHGLSAGLLLLISVLLHELGHSLAAMAFGCRVRDITLMMIGGCASMLSMPRKAWQEFVMAFAGPLVSLILGLGCWALFIFGPALFHTGFIGFMCWWVMTLNLTLFFFNLIPAFPMDGGRILRAFLQQFFMTRVKATWVASRIGRGVAILMVLGVVFSFLTGKFGGYMLIRLLVAYTIYQSAEREYQMVLMEEGYDNKNPFSRFGFPFFGRTTRTPPPDDGQAYVSPPPYDRGHGTRVDVFKD